MMILDHCRNKEELFNLYQTRPMNDGIFDFEFIYNNPHLYCFYDKDKGFLRGYINIYKNETEKLLLSGASIRHNMPENINAIIKVCEAYDDDMYAETDKKEAKICLLKAGFKKLKNNFYVRYKNG